MIGSRIKYYLTKLKQASSDGTLSERVRRKLVDGTKAKAATGFAYKKLSREDRSLAVRAGYSDHREPTRSLSDADRQLLDRLNDAYQLAKADQQSVRPEFEIRGLWAEWIEINYRPLVKSLESRDYKALDNLLSNFSREQIAVGTGSSYDDMVMYKTSLFGGIYAKTVWCDYRDKLIEIGGDVNDIEHPMVGNPAGIPVNGSVIPTETLRHAYNAYSIADLLVDVERPVVVEIGGGFGGQAFQTVDRLRKVSNPISKYLNFDIPEVLFIASYFLMKSLPELRFRLYGEGRVSTDAEEEFDIGLFPYFSIGELSDRSVDLAFNSHSFSEMDGSTSSAYLRILNRICSRYFMHINHETRLTFEQTDGSKSENKLGSELVPDMSVFKRIYKRPRVYGRPEDRPFKSFAYLYERIR